MEALKLAQIKKSLYDMAFLDIKRASDGKSKMGTFILASCFIEYLAGFRVGGETKGRDYKAFVRDFLPSLYDPDKLYHDLRCKLVHNYSEGGSYAFTFSQPSLHGTNVGGRLIINLEDFIQDLEEAYKKFESILDGDTDAQTLAERRYDSIGLIGVAAVSRTPHGDGSS